MTIAYSDNRVTAEIEVQTATVLIGIRHTRMHQEASEAAKNETDVDRIIARTVLYPALISASTGNITVDGKTLPWPPDFETFVRLPESLEAQWESEVFRLNPHWLPQPKGKEAEKKDESSPG